MPYRHYHQAIGEAIDRANEAVPDASKYADRTCAKCGEQADYRLAAGGGGMMRYREISDTCVNHRNTDEHANMSVFQSYTKPMNDVPQKGPQKGYDRSKYSWEQNA